MSYILVGSWPYTHGTYSRPGAVHTHDQAHARSRDQAHACTSWRSCSWAVTARRSCSWSWAADGRFVCHIQTRPGPRELRAPGRRAGAAGAQLARSWCAAGAKTAHVGRPYRPAVQTMRQLWAVFSLPKDYPSSRATTTGRRAWVVVGGFWAVWAVFFRPFQSHPRDGFTRPTTQKSSFAD